MLSPWPRPSDVPLAAHPCLSTTCSALPWKPGDVITGTNITPGCPMSTQRGTNPTLTQQITDWCCFTMNNFLSNRCCNIFPRTNRGFIFFLFSIKDLLQYSEFCNVLSVLCIFTALNATKHTQQAAPSVGTPAQVKFCKKQSCDPAVLPWSRAGAEPRAQSPLPHGPTCAVEGAGLLGGICFPAAQQLWMCFSPSSQGKTFWQVQTVNTAKQ